MVRYRREKREDHDSSIFYLRLRYGAIFIGALFFFIIIRLFIFMIVRHGEYTAIAANSQELFAKLFPARGEIYVQDSRSKEEYPLAINRDLFLVYADTTKIHDEAAAKTLADAIAPIFSYDEEKKNTLFIKLNRRTDPYEPLEKSVNEETISKLKELKSAALGFVRLPERYYPEGVLAAHVVGFVGQDSEGQTRGRYGIEGYWQDILAGNGGYVAGAKSPGGRLISLAGKDFQAPEDGSDLLLTLDRTMQFKACERLRQAWQEYGALSAALVIMEPKTGAILVMCSFPDFNPNTYNTVSPSTVGVYNNTAIFGAYEPGSIFKPVAMAGALNEGIVTPTSAFHDTGKREGLCAKPIQNALQKSYGDQTMGGVLIHSINTGMVYVAEKLGKPKFLDYIERFGFGIKEGLELDTESSGTIDSLKKKKSDALDCYTATASFGQGITVTPLQMATAYSAIANGGLLMKPYIVEEIRHTDGRVEKTKPKEIRRVVDSRTAVLLSSMLVNVIEQGEGKLSRVPNYYLAGKTGTAQIAGPGGYTDEYNHSFAGFGPVDDPKFVVVIKLEKPARGQYASYTAAVVFREISKFLVQYYNIPPHE